MSFDEIVSEIRDYRENEAYIASISNKSSENQSESDLSWHDCAEVVMSWTNIPPNFLSSKEVADFICRAGPNLSEEKDGVLKMHSWISRAQQGINN